MPAKTPSPRVVVRLSDDEMAELAAALRADVARLESELRSAEEELADLIADSGDGAGDDQVDSGSKVLERDHELVVNANTRELLEQSRHALERVAAGTYGICESCGEPISSGRMHAFPRATLCIGCKQRAERR